MTIARRIWLVLGCAAVAGSAACGDAPVTAPAPVASIKLTALTDVLVVGDREQLRATPRSAGGDSLARPVSWQVSDSSVATISTTGLLTVHAVTDVVVIASSEGRQDLLTIHVAPAQLPFLRQPFDSAFRMVSPFDHDLPYEFKDDNGVFVDWKGQSLHGFIDGHNGYDWIMPEGTPLRAAAAGTVIFAGSESPWSCPFLNGRTVAAIYVSLRHTAPSAEAFLTQYVHLSRLDVSTGDVVAAGQVIGLSGNTGCSTTPHLHFAVYRERYGRAGGAWRVTDPYGWAGTYLDPWLLHPAGAASTRLWLTDLAPPYRYSDPHGTGQLGPLDAPAPVRQGVAPGWFRTAPAPTPPTG